MKTVFLSLAVFFSMLTTFAQDAEGINITVTIDNIASDEGKVLASLYTEENFMKGPGAQSLQSDIENGKVTLVFENVAAGIYAISAMHDANNNLRMDFEANGMPKESYGMSGNEMSMGPPTFDMAKFEVGDEDLEFNIRF